MAAHWELAIVLASSGIGTRFSPIVAYPEVLERRLFVPGVKLRSKP